jgi:hypothetical protein
MYPAARGNTFDVIAIATIFSVVTIATMTAAVLIGSFGLSKIRLGRGERYAHALAGLLLFLCGSGIKIFGL